MDNILVWCGIAVAAYAFSPTFRREVNGWIVKLAGRVQHDTNETANAKETHILEDVAFLMFQEDHPGDPRTAQGWANLPPDIRKKYITRAVHSIAPPSETAPPKP